MVPSALRLSGHDITAACERSSRWLFHFQTQCSLKQKFDLNKIPNIPALAAAKKWQRDKQFAFLVDWLLVF